MAEVARITRTGDPEVIEWVTVDLPVPASGEVQIETRAVGLNYIDTYYRRGIYPAALPSGLGHEASAVVVAVGPGVDDFAIGDRVATFGPAAGAYATARNVPVADLFRIPDDIDDEIAAASLLKGCTAEFLAERASHVAPGDHVLVHAGAGGVGQMLVQWLTARGAHVIATAGSEEKAALARAAGARETILYRHEDVAARVRALTDGAGVRVSYDGVGRDTWEASLASTARRGLVISYGNASAPVTGVALGILAQKGSLFVTRPMLYDYYRDPDERAAGAAALWEMIRSDRVKVTIGQRFALRDAGSAHMALESRQTTGSTLLIP